MSRIMFIDGSHREQIRVAVTEKSRVVEFDVESCDNKQTIGNIYLAKVTRVEPSLQAAFVEYGSDRQGFLSFSEIHPDYFQIPLEDRKRLLEEAAEYFNSEEEGDGEFNDEEFSKDIDSDYNIDNETSSDNGDAGDADYDNQEKTPEISEYAVSSHTLIDTETSEDLSHDSAETEQSSQSSPEKKALRKPKLPKYKIQEVIKKRQILLVQVLKSERGNKGAALTTYLSLAGRYCVLMPNTARGGGISRKITNIADRQKLREIIRELDVPKGMGLIIRTAGLQRTKAELRRDYEYLMRLWDNVRQLTMSSVAPALVYEEGNLIKRTLRDLYSRDMTKILVQGNDVYKECRDVMKMIMPSSVRSIHHYENPLPLFMRYQIERQLDELTNAIVHLKSGGYLVINHTEALIAIDINSGRSTSTYSIEETALRTNLEAAEEIARQLRLRDLAGLIVIDFIDMEDYGNVRTIEKKMRDCVKNDKARLQIAPISMFGLMEMTRQRLRPAMKDLMSIPCHSCHGNGYVPSLETSSLRVLRAAYEEIAIKSISELKLDCSIDIAHYILNKKRKELLEIEEKYECMIQINGSSKMAYSEYEIESVVSEIPKVRKAVEFISLNDENDDIIDDIIDEDKPDISPDNGTEDSDQQEFAHNNKRSRFNNRKKQRLGQKLEKDSSFKQTTTNSNDDTNWQRQETRTDNRRSKFGKNNGRNRFADRFSKEPEIVVLTSGQSVIVENSVSVRNNIIDNQENISEIDNEIKVINSNEIKVINIESVIDNHSDIVDNNIALQSDSLEQINDNQQTQDNPERKTRKPRSRKNTKSDAISEMNFEIQDDTNNQELVANNDDFSNVDVPDLVSEAVAPQVSNKQTSDEDSGSLDMNAISKEDNANEEQKPARRGWWRNRFGL